MPGELRGAVVVIEDEPEANRIHNKGFPGIPQSGGSLKLGLLEAAFLMDEKGFEILDVTNLIELFHHASRYIRDFEVQYIVYRVLKLRGFFVKIPDSHFQEGGSGGKEPSEGESEHNGDGKNPVKYAPFPNEPFRLLPRGSRPSVAASVHVLPISERNEFVLERMVEFSRECIRLGVEGLAGVVDEDGDVTFYSIKLASPEGDCQTINHVRITGTLGQNRVLVPLDKTSGALQEQGFFGQAMGSMINLSLIEALYLMESGLLVIENTSPEILFATAQREQPDVDLRYRVYRQLRDRGVRVKTGFKYGTHFRAYSMNPHRSHADYLVHVFPDGTTVDWQEISRGIRVAHGVNKRILFTTPLLVERNEFLELAWVKP